MSALLDLPHLKSWVGKTQSVEDVITLRLANSLAAILDEPTNLVDGDIAPAGIHWCLAPDIAQMSKIGSDGHPARGGFLPPVPLPRRMWAAGQLHFRGNFHVGDKIKRTSTVQNVEIKEGRSGTLCFVTVAHEYHGNDGLLLSERQDIVYREITPTAEQEPPQDVPRGDVSIEYQATPVLLARYSAVTFNGHRIHYDRDYARDEELYLGLVVHGPLQANWLLKLAKQEFTGSMPEHFSFKGRSPLFDNQVATANALKRGNGELHLWVAAQNGLMTLEASARAFSA